MISAETLSPAQIAYREYLKSDHWRGLRMEAFRAYGRKCHNCPKTSGLDVHHLRYRYPWTSGVVTDLQILCRACHDKAHGIVAVPVLVKKAAQKVAQFVPRIERLLQRVQAGARLSDQQRQFLHNKLMHGSKSERATANAAFQLNSRIAGQKKSNIRRIEKLLMKRSKRASRSKMKRQKINAELRRDAWLSNKNRRGW